MKRMIALTALAASLAFAAPAAAVVAAPDNVVASDNFETPDSPGISYGGTDTAGAVFGDGTGLQQNGSPFGYMNTPDGNQTAHIQGQGSFTYFVPGLTNGDYYTLSFLYASRPGYGVDGLTVSYVDADLTDPVIFTGTPGSTTFTQQSTTFQYFGSGSIFLTFAGTMAQGADAAGNPATDYNVAVDRVSLTGAVPEPATWAMMLLGFGMIGFGLRNRRSVVARTVHA